MNDTTTAFPETRLYDVLNTVFGVEEFRSSQKDIVIRTLAGGHSLVLMPTGMGKSLLYQLPALLMDGLTVVISPLIALMKDQVDGLRRMGIDAACINSSQGKAERESRYRDVGEGKYRLLYVSPERFRNRDFIKALQARSVSLLALDEAHCVSRWGNDFRPDYSRVGEFREIMGCPVTIALTATATPEVRDDIVEKLGLAQSEVRVFNEGVTRPNLSLEVAEFLDEGEKFDALYETVSSTSGSIIVYFSLIKSIERFARFLDMKRRDYLIYHGRLDPGARRRSQQRFLEAPSSLMLATNAFGMGIDKPDIRMILHAEIPDSVESYYQEIGRAGRDGKPSRCMLAYCQDDLAVQLQFLEWKNPDAGFIKNAHRLFASLGDTLKAYSYEELQEKLVYKHRADHRLQTVLNLFDLYGVTEGSPETFNLRLVAEPPEELLSEKHTGFKKDHDSRRLADMLNYVKTGDCRRTYIHRYFGMEPVSCRNCDNCTP